MMNSLRVLRGEGRHGRSAGMICRWMATGAVLGFVSAGELLAVPVFFTSNHLPPPVGSYVDPECPVVWQTYVGSSC